MRSSRLFVALAWVGLLAGSLMAQVSVNGYKYAMVMADNDGLSIQDRVISMLESEGIKVIANPNTIDPK